MLKSKRKSILLLGSIFCVSIFILGLYFQTQSNVLIILNQASEFRDCSIVLVSLNNVDILDTVKVCNDELFFSPSLSGFSSTSYLNINTLYLKVFDDKGEKLDEIVFDVEFWAKKCIKVTFLEYKVGVFSHEVIKDFTCFNPIEPY